MLKFLDPFLPLPTLTAVAGLGLLPPFVCVSVFPHDISKLMQLGSPNLIQKMFQDKSWKPIYFGVKRQDHE